MAPCASNVFHALGDAGFHRIACTDWGAQFEVLTRRTIDEMRERKPGIEIAEFDGVGHAPALMNPDQIAVAKDFVLR